MQLVRIIAIGGALLSASAVVTRAQIPVAPPGRTHSFEVASVKPSDPEERIVGGPEWLDTARFVIDARSALAPDGATAARDIGFMLRTLLADRFGLRVRLEPRPQRVYALVRAPGPCKPGVTLRPTETECAKNSAGCGIGGGAGRMDMRGTPLDLLVFALAEAAGRPVVNRTGLEGLFDGSLEWAPSPEETPATFGGAPAPIETLVITQAELPSPN